MYVTPTLGKGLGSNPHHVGSNPHHVGTTTNAVDTQECPPPPPNFVPYKGILCILVITHWSAENYTKTEQLTVNSVYC